MRRLCSSSSSPSSVVYSSPAISSRPLVRRTRSQHCFPAKNAACASVINDTLGTSLVLEEEKKKKRGKERTSRRRKALLSIVLPLPLLSGADILGLDCAARAEENKQTSAFFGAGDGQQLVSYFRELSYRGVKAATVGIADGREVVRVKFDESRLPFSDLLRVYFRRVDASDGGGQFKERGERYAPVIFAPDEVNFFLLVQSYPTSLSLFRLKKTFFFFLSTGRLPRSLQSVAHFGRESDFWERGPLACSSCEDHSRPTFYLRGAGWQECCIDQR